MSKFAACIDYKPKRFKVENVRDGHVSELANILPIEGATVSLPGTKVSGVLGWDNLRKRLSNIWFPHVQETQLIGVLRSLSGISSLVNIGKELKQLVIDPIENYQDSKTLARGNRY